MNYLSEEHPKSEHRNFIGVQRACVMKRMDQQVAELYKEGNSAEADRTIGMMIELQAVWDNESD